MNKIVFMSMFSALVLIGANITPNMNTVKIATADSQQIVDNMPEAKGIQAQMQKLRQDAEAEFASKVQKFQADFQEYDTKKEMLTPEKRRQTETELQAKNQELQQFQQIKNQELQQRNIDLFRPLQDRVLTAISEIAKKEGFTVVFDTANSLASVVLYADDSIDITFKVLDHLKTAKVAPTGGTKKPTK